MIGFNYVKFMCHVLTPINSMYRMKKVMINKIVGLVPIVRNRGFSGSNIFPFGVH